MARPKTKNCRPLSIRLDETIYNRLDEFTTESGQSKTVAIERALTMYIDDYKKKQALIAQAEKH